jgi:hypothetical protein
MSIDVPAQELTWVKRFFSGQNNLRWLDIESGQAAENRLAQVIPWIKFLSNGSAFDRPIVLPLYSSDGSLTWYGMASNEQIFSKLVEDIGSFIGPSYGNFHIGRTDPCNNSEQEIAIKERFGTCVISFSPQRPDDQSQIEKALLLYQSLLARRPLLPNRTQRPFGKIRGDFDRALLAGNARNAQSLLDELKSSGRIDAGQQKCLEIRMLAGLGWQKELARNQLLISSVVDLVLPAQILVDVIDALYEIYIRPIETSHDLNEIFAVFKQHIFRPFGYSLFRDRKGISIPTVLRSFLLFELIQSEPNTKRCGSILSAYAESADGRGLADRWYSLLQSKHKVVQVGGPQSFLDMVRRAIADEDYATACELSFKLLPDYWAYSTLLRCATELGSIEITKKILTTVSDASSDVKSQFKQKDLARLESLQLISEASTSEKPDSSWIGWAQAIQKGASFTTSIAILNESIVKWSVDNYAHDIDRCGLLAQIIGNANGDQAAIYREIFPFLVEFFVERPSQPYRTFTPIYATIIKILGWSCVLSSDELEIVSSLTLALLTSGPSQSVYIECVDDLHEIIKVNN